MCLLQGVGIVLKGQLAAVDVGLLVLAKLLGPADEKKEQLSLSRQPL
jgi:hypothetical protein